MIETFGPAKISDVVVYAGEVGLPDLRVNHVLAFQAHVENLDRRPNAFVVPIPSKRPVTAWSEPSSLRPLVAPLVRMNRQVSVRSQIYVDQDPGSFAVSMVHQVDGFIDAVASVPPDIRPKMNRKVIRELGSKYPGWSFALCCWDGTFDSRSLLWEDDPLNPKQVFFPAFADPWLIVGSTHHPFGIQTRAAVANNISSMIWGQKMGGDALDMGVSVPFIRGLKNEMGPHDLHARLDPKTWDISWDVYSSSSS